MNIVKTTAAVFAALVSGAAFAEFSTDTISFYGFTGASAGTSGAGVTFQNDAASGTYSAHGIAYDHPNVYEKGLVKVEADAPGKYIFGDVTSTLAPDPIFTDPQSLYLTSTNYNDPVSGSYASSGGRISFDVIETALSGCTEFTVEFFWKIPSDERAQVEYNGAFLLSGATGSKWLTYLGDSTQRGIGVAFPLVKVASGNNAKTIALFDTKSAWGNYCMYPSAITHDEWHHLALTFKNGAFKVYGDYIYYSANLKGVAGQSETAGYSITQLATDVPLLFGLGNNGNTASYHGKVSCFRFSSKALEVKDFLHASDLPHYRDVRVPDPVSMGSDTFAFYSFREGAGKVGESADGAMIVNDANMNAHPGTVTAKTADGGLIVYDDDAPAAYVFDGYTPGATACFTNPMSLDYNRGTTYTGTTLFENIGTELSKSEDSTVEFFWKMHETMDCANYWDSVVCNGGATNSAGEAIAMTLWIPSGNTGSSAQNVRLSKYRTPATHYIYTSYPEAIQDGKWHHIAVTYSSSLARYELFCDYVSAGTVPGLYRSPLGTSEPLKLGWDYYSGKFSCLRASKKALKPEEMLHVSTQPTITKSIFHYRLQELSAGDDFSEGVHNCVTPYSTYIPNVYYTLNEVHNGSGIISSEYYPRQNAKTWWTQVKDFAGATPVANTGSAYFQTTPKASSSVIFANGPQIRGSSSDTQTGSMTMEMFARFDYDGFLARIGNVFDEVRDRVALMSHERNSTAATWKLYMQNVKSTAQLQLGIMYKDGTFANFSYTIGSAVRNRWHHYAVTYDKENLKIALWVDRVKVIDQALDQELNMQSATSSTCYYEFGGGGNNQPFDGWLDEIRLSKGALSVDEFLRPDGARGTTLMYR